MEKVASGIVIAILMEFGLLFAIYCWNWLGSNILPDFLKMCLVFQNVQEFVISTATRYLNLFGIIIACVVRGWLYLCGHIWVLNYIKDEFYDSADLTEGDMFISNFVIAAVVLTGIYIFGFPDEGECFVAAYVLSLILAGYLFHNR